MSIESIPRAWRGIKGGRTKMFQGKVVARLDNPGTIVEFNGGVYIEEDGKLKPASNEEVKIAREWVLFKR